MRHPTTGLSEDDLSRLTGSSSNTSSSLTTPSHDNTPNNGNNPTKSTCSIIPLSRTSDEHIKNFKNSQHQLQQNANFNSSYLPEIIDPLEWQKSRKRKERQDSTSSTTQDRKLVRSNSEELLPNEGGAANCEVIRRVSSSEDFKRPLCELKDNLRTICENDNSDTKENNMTKHARNHETSPARSTTHRQSPNRDYRRYKETDDSDCENERRRSSERFCKSRAPPGRKAGVMKKSGAGKYIQKFRTNDENVYKYDISALKHERRGFVSKFKIEERGQRKEEATDGQHLQNNDFNDNNLIDFRTIRNDNRNRSKIAAKEGNETPSSQNTQQQDQQEKQQKHQIQQQKYDSSAEALPWDCVIKHQREDETPVLCRRRFEDMDDDDTVDGDTTPTTSTENSTNFYQFESIPQIITDNEPVKSFRTFTKMENIKTREIMQQSLPPISFQTPEERLKHVNKKLTAMKKKLVLLEESFEKKNGYRPSQVEKFNDKQIKSTLAEISKLKKEKHELKLDPMAALGLKISGGLDVEKKLDNMRETVDEIEKKLIEKREECNRPDSLDHLTSSQLVHEKTSVQHALLYFQSLYGRPSNKEERDVARPLYDRYRLLKRMVSRSITVAGVAGCTSELPTILENEAMVFNFESVQLTTSASTDSTSPIEPMTTFMSSIESPSDNSSSPPSTESLSFQQRERQKDETEDVDETSHSQQSSQSLLGENVHTLSIDELWEHLEKARDEKRELKRIIREYETLFEERNGRKMLKTDRKFIEDTYGQYKELKAKVRLLQALIKKQISR